MTDWTASVATRRELNDTEAAVATLAGNLIVQSGFDVVAAANDLNIRFILLKASPTSPTVSAIASHNGVEQVGQTANGVLWTVNGDTRAREEHTGRNYLYVGLAALAVAIAVIASIPTTLPRRRQLDDELVLSEGEPDA